MELKAFTPMSGVTYAV